MKRSFALLRRIGRRQKPAQSRWQTTNSTQQHFVSSVRPSTYPTNVQGTRPNGKEINKALSDKASPMRNKTRAFEFVPANLKLRTWLPDEIYSILLQTPTLIPSSLPGAPPDGKLPPVPTQESLAEEFLEDERTNRPRHLIYRFYACGGFWLGENRHVAHFLRSLMNEQLVESIPFIRQVMKARTQYFVPSLYLQTENPRRVHVPSAATLAGAKEKRDKQLVYDELFRALAWQGRDMELLSLWEEAESLGVKMDWRSYIYLFRCFQRCPSPQIHLAIKVYRDFRQNSLAEPLQKAIVANVLINLILQRARPEMVNEHLTLDEILGFTLELLSTVIEIQNTLPVTSEPSRLNPARQFSAEQRRVILYFRLCGCLQAPDKVQSFYKRTRERGIKFNPTMYAHALSAATHSESAFRSLSKRVLADMAQDRIKPNVDIRLALLRGSATCAALDDAFRHFRQIEAANQVDPSAIRALLQGFNRRLWNNGGHVNPLKLWSEENHIKGRLLQAFEGSVKTVVFGFDLGSRISNATILPFTQAATQLPGLVAQCIGTVWYLARRYPNHFVETVIYNQYLSFMIRCRLPTTMSLFRDCFDHFPLSDERKEELACKLDPEERTVPAYWPFPPLVDFSFVPKQLPRPDKYTFVRAMEYAHFTRNPQFATEVWFRRQAWRTHLEKAALEDLENNRWSEFDDDDLLRYERTLVSNSTSMREWARSTATLSKWSDGASDTLYEGYTRLLYIQTLAACGWMDEAYKMVLQGTGERYPWTQNMLEKVLKHAANFEHKELYQYIKNLEASGSQHELERIQDDLV